MGTARSTASKAIALQSKVLCVLVILSLLGQAVPVLARELIDVASSGNAAQSSNLSTEQLPAPHPTQPAAPATAANEDCFSVTTNVPHRIFLPLITRNSSGAMTAASISSTPLIPADPGTVAPPLDRSVATDIFQATTFLYSGGNPIQTGVAPGTIGPRCVAVLRGQVLARDGQPLAGVALSIHNHPEYGQTLSRADGLFDLVINGGQVILSYTKEGYLPVQRKVQARWREYTPVEPVVMTPLDTRVTTVVLTSTAAIQVARGNVISDTDGQRQATLLFPSNTQAVITLTNGTTQTLNTLNVRATEYTVGGRGIQAMPGNLPAQSGYTYAAEFSVDGADAAGAADVRFDKAVINYTENFIHAPIGSPVPTGYYDRAQGKWIPAKNGRVIKILSETAGKADVDVTGDGVADTGATLTALGITDAEREQLANLYNAGQELWRVEVTHFTPWDHNWPYGPPPGARPPQLTWFNNEEPDPCSTKGSSISCETQTLGESVPVVGSPFSLVYQSDRVPGYKAGRTLDIPVTGSALPPLLKGVRLQIQIAGRTFEQRWEDPTSPISGTTPYPPIVPNLNYHFEWDGLDAYGRLMQGRPVAAIRVMYIYDFFYYRAGSAFESSFAQFGDNVDVWDGRLLCRDVATRFFCGIPIEQVVYRTLGPWDATPIDGLGGWTLDIHHSYDPAEQVVHKGDGSLIRAETLGAIYTSIAGGGSKVFPAAEGGSALDANIDALGDIAVRPDGSVYFYQGFYSYNHIRKIDPNGIITTYAGNGLKGDPTGDGGPALQATLGHMVNAIATGPDGSLYLAVQANTWPRGYIRKIDPNGIITTIAGNGQGVSGKLGDGGPAIDAEVSDPIDVVVGPDGSIYFSERGTSFNNNKGRVRRIDLNGMIYTIAGGGTDATRDEDLGNGEPATQHDIKLPYHLAFGPDGSLYIPDPTEHVVKRVTPDGIIRRFAGARYTLFGGDGGPALQANLGDPVNVAVSSDGVVYIRARTYYDRIRKVTPDGMITAYAGRDDNCGASLSPDGIAAQQACIFTNSTGLEIHPDGSLIVGDGRHRIRRIALPLPGFSANSLLIPSPNGAELYEFNSLGRHLRTLDGLTGVTRYQFAYDAAGRLSDVIDANGRITHIERTANGTPTAIVAPNGQRTTMTLGNDGYLATIANPASETTSLIYRPGGLLATLTDPRGGIHNFIYDGPGRLISDQGPSGEIKTLTRSLVQGLTTVTVTTGLNRSTIYATEVLSTGDRLRTVIAPDGSKTTLRIGLDGTQVSADPNGTHTTITLGPDPRWGMRTPLAGSVIITTPGGLRRETVFTRRVTLADRNNPMSLQTITDQVTTDGRQSSSTYDSAARTVTVRSAEGRQFDMTLDALGRAVKEAAPNLLPTGYVYDGLGQLITMTEGTGQEARAVNLSYASNDELEAVTDSLGHTVRFAYDAVGRVVTQTLPDGQQIVYAHDANGNLAALVPPGRPAHIFAYTPANQLASYTPPDIGAGGGSGQTQYTYDADGALTRVTRPDGQVLDLSYDSAGRLVSLTQPRGSVSYVYNTTTGNLKMISAPGGISLSYAYDGALLTNETWAGAIAGSTSRAYDNNLHVIGSTINGSNVVGFQYDKDNLLVQAGALSLNRDAESGLLTGSTLGSIVDTWRHNGLAEPISYSVTYNGASLYDVRYSRDTLGRIMAKTEILGGVTNVYTYTYDLAGRLTGVQRNGATVANLTYDGNGNRQSFTGPNGTITADYDHQDRLTRYGSTIYTYTANGELSSKTVDNQTTAYQYDLLGNLMAVTLPDGTQITYLVDGQNRRVGEQVNGVLVRGFLYEDGPGPVAELDGAGNVVSRFIYATQVNVPDYMVKGGVTYRLIGDHLGSPRLVVNVATGQVVQQMAYDEFGQVLTDTNPGFQPFGFAGGLYDADTGLVRFGARDYDAETGRWTAKDPALFDSGDINLYSYAINDPLNSRDPVGLDWQDWDLSGAANFAAGFGDVLSFGLTSWINEQTGADKFVNPCSSAYSAGQWSGVALSTAIGGAQGLKAAGAKAAGREFSHWIPNRVLKGTGSNWLRNTFGRSRLNGNYVSSLRHYLHDPFRFPKGWRNMGPRFNPLLGQLDRVPRVYYGTGAGLGAGLAGKGISSQPCPCN